MDKEQANEELKRRVTELEAENARLRASENWYREIFNASNDAILVHDAVNGAILDVNQTMLGMYEYGYDEALQLGMNDLSPGESPFSQDEAVELIRKAIREGPQVFEWVAQKKSGERFWAEVALWSSEIMGQKRILAVVRDITDRKRAVEALRESEEKYRTLVENINDVVFALDSRSCFTYISPVIERLAGYKMNEIIGQPFQQFVVPDDLPDLISSLERTLSGQLEPFEFRALKKDGTMAYVRTFSRLLLKEGQSVGLTGTMTDITAQKQAQQALQESEEKYRSIVEHALTGMFTVDEKYQFIYINDELCQILGYSQEEMIGMDFRQVLTENSRDFVADRYARRQRGEPVPNRYELELVRKDGELRYGEMSVTLVRDRIGRPRSMGQLADITERKQAEESLRESEYRHRLITELISDYAYVYQVEPDGTFSLEWITVEPALRMTGYDPRQEIGSSFVLYHPEDRDKVRRHVQETIEGKPTSDDYRILTKVGELRWLHIDRRPVWDPEQKRVVRFFGVAQDITERKLAEEALQVKEYAIESSINAIAIADLRGNLTYVNPSFLKLWGYDSEEEVLERSAVSFWFEPAEAQDIVTALADHHSWQGEMVAKRKDGSLFTAQLSASLVVDAAGQPVNMMASFVDITDQKQAEAERETLIAELEAKNAELERFTYTVSHDLKSPLVTINGFLGLLEKDVAKQDTPRIQGDIQRIREAAERMQLLLDDLLELSRIGRLVNPPGEVDLSELAREAIELVAGQIAERGVQIDIDPDLPVVYGDRPRLMEVYQNLIQNAVKFMGDQPEPRIEIGVREEEKETIFYVRDNGIGIEPAYHQKVFGLFDRLDPLVEGTGIGLALVKRIVEVSGGRIWVESAGAGQGSTLLFTLPFAPGEE